MATEPVSIQEEYGNVKYIYHVPAVEMNKRIQEFMSSPREFTAYPADRVEAVARHYNLIPQNAHYSCFIEENNILVFVVNNRSHGEPRWLEQAKGFIKKLFG